MTPASFFHWKGKNMNKKIGITIIIIGLVMCIICLAGFIATAHADDKSYSRCVAECQTDVMNLEQCIKDEKDYWDSKQTSYGALRLSCKQLIQNEKLDCKIDCVVEEIKKEKPSQRAVEFWDKNVKNFPDTNE
jgi:hypothetical protein